MSSISTTTPNSDMNTHMGMHEYSRFLSESDILRSELIKKTFADENHAMDNLNRIQKMLEETKKNTAGASGSPLAFDIQLAQPDKNYSLEEKRELLGEVKKLGGQSSLNAMIQLLLLLIDMRTKNEKTKGEMRSQSNVLMTQYTAVQAKHTVDAGQKGFNAAIWGAAATTAVTAIGAGVQGFGRGFEKTNLDAKPDHIKSVKKLENIRIERTTLSHDISGAGGEAYHTAKREVASHKNALVQNDLEINALSQRLDLTEGEAARLQSLRDAKPNLQRVHDEAHAQLVLRPEHAKVERAQELAGKYDRRQTKVADSEKVMAERSLDGKHWETGGGVVQGIGHGAGAAAQAHVEQGRAQETAEGDKKRNEASVAGQLASERDEERRAASTAKSGDFSLLETLLRSDIESRNAVISNIRAM